MKQNEIKKMGKNNIWKTFLGLFLAICIIVSMQSGYVYASGSYTSDWQRWSQGASSYSAMKYGCRVTAYAKMLAEAGCTGFGNPDGFFEWGKSKGYFRASDTCELTSIGTAPVTYVNGNGGTASLVGRQSLSGNKTTDANTIMNLINQGYYVVLTCSAHSAYVGREASLSQGTAVILDSWASKTVGPSFQYKKYTQYTFTTANYFRIENNSAKNNPQGSFDGAVGGVGKVRVTGWTFDPNDVARSIPVHIYIGGPAGSGEGHAVTANTARGDVDNVYHVGLYHGFDVTLNTSFVGTQQVYVYAINIGAGDNVLLGSKTVHIDADTTAPTISDIQIVDKNRDGYTITCKVEDAGGVAKVQFPTWTTYGDQDDLTANWWESASCRGTQNGTTWSYRVNTSDHNNEEGHYNTHIYAWDAAGNSSCAHVNGIYIDRTAPVISEVEIVDMDATGYTVICKVEDAGGEVTKVQFPTWTVENGQDDLTENWINNPSCTGTRNGAVWSYRVNDSAHNFERGTYRTHIYAWDSYGNSQSAGSCYEINNIELQNDYQPVSTITSEGHTYRLYNDCLTWEKAKVKCEELGGHLVTITSAEEQDAVAGLLSGQARIGYWIGGKKDGGSTWVTGEEFSYSNWDPGEPNETDGEDKYGIYTDRMTWNDWTNTRQGLGFICEWDGGQSKEQETVTFSIDAFDNLDYTFPTIDGGTASTKALSEKDVTLLVFGRTTCASTWLTLKNIAESSFVHDPKVSVIYVDIEGADAETVKACIDKYAQLSGDVGQYRRGCDKIIFCHDAENKNEEARKMYHTLSGKWGTIYLPMTVIIDKNNIVREMLTNVQTADEILPVVNQVIIKGNEAERDGDQKGDMDKKEDTDKDEDTDKKEDADEKPRIVRPENVCLSSTSLTWNGKTQTPGVIARDGSGKVISAANYTVAYSNNKNVGQAFVVVTFKNGYSGTIKKTFIIKPKGTSISRLTAKKKGFVLKWKKQKSQTTGYEIQYSASSKFKGAKILKNIKLKTTSKKVTKLKAGKKYYVRMRTYKAVKVNGKSAKIYSDWSKAKKVVTKK